jgi:hypothetical protein
MRKTSWIVGGLVVLVGIGFAHAFGPGLHPCTRLERELCAGLGTADCARWREQGQPGLPSEVPAFRGRGRRALGDAFLMLALGWDPSLPTQVCRGLSQPASRAKLLKSIAGVLQ